MDDSLAAWLALREPHDWAAREGPLADTLVQALAPREPLRILDLGTGTGSNMRYLVPRLPPIQEWVLVDRSPDVLRVVQDRTTTWAASRGLLVGAAPDGFVLEGGPLRCRVRLAHHDVGLPLTPALFEGHQLITASALLDLASDAWLRALAAACRASGSAALFALTYDGHSAFAPPDPDDDLARELLNAHQQRDKGLGGPAEGPGAHARAVHWFRAHGFEVHDGTSPWRVDAAATAFQRHLIAGVAAAAAEQQPDAAPRIAAWHARRLACLQDGRSTVFVGHRDLAAWLPAHERP